MLVVDASVAAKWFLDEPLRAEARHILQRRRDTAAPDFILIELANVAWKKHRRGEISERQAYRTVDEAVGLFSDVMFNLIPSEEVLKDAAALAVELAHPVYDCLYLACAGGPEDVLVTADRRFFARIKDSRHADRILFLTDPAL